MFRFRKQPPAEDAETVAPMTQYAFAYIWPMVGDSLAQASGESWMIQRLAIQVY